MRDPSGATTRDVIAGCLKTFARAGKSGATPASPLWARARNAVGSQAAKTSGPVGRRISQVLGGIARSFGGLFGEDNQTTAKEGSQVVAMCPACLANAVLIAVGATSGGGLTAFVLRTFFRRTQTNKDQRKPK